MHKNPPSPDEFPRAFIRKQIAVLMSAVLLLGIVAETVHASSWNPTVLVNTEAFQIIHEGDSTTDIDLRFGDTVNEKLYWDRANAEFRFSDDIRADGNITGSGTLTVSGNVKTKADLTINSDDGAANAVLTFGNDNAAQTLTFLDTQQKFSFSKDTRVLGNLSGSSLNVDGNAGIYGTLTVSGATTLKSTLKINGVTYTFPYSDGTASGKVLKTSGAGVLSWSTDTDTADFANLSSYFVNDTGDTMTGALTIKRVSGTTQNLLTVSGGSIVVQTTAPNNSVDLVNVSGGSLKVSGNINATGTILSVGNISTRGDLTLNTDNGAADTVLTFGSDTTAETLKFLNNEDRFEFSDDLRVTGGTYASGALIVDGAATFKSTLKLNGTTYTFPTSDGSASGQVLKTSAAGKLSWASLRGSGGLVSLHPDYPNALYFGSGSTNVGTLALRVSSGSEIGNTYRWQTTRTTNQNYWIQVRARLPDTFTSWEATPIQLRYRTMSGYINTYMRDTAGTAVSLTNGSSLNTSSWTTASITGPEAAGTWTGGGYFTFLLRLTNSGATAGKEGRSFTDVGFLNFNMDTKLP